MVRSIKRLRLKKLAEKIGQKARGFLLIEGILQVVILGMLAIGCSALFSSQFSLLGASQTGNQAQEVASVEAEYLKQLGYDEVSKGTGVHEKQDMTKLLGDDRGKQWQSKVTLLPPINVGDSDDDKIQIARVDVFKPGENASRYSTEVPLSSQGGINNILEMLNLDLEHPQQIYPVSKYIMPHSGLVKVENSYHLQVITFEDLTFRYATGGQVFINGKNVVEQLMPFSIISETALDRYKKPFSVYKIDFPHPIIWLFLKKGDVIEVTNTGLYLNKGVEIKGSITLEARGKKVRYKSSDFIDDKTNYAHIDSIYFMKKEPQTAKLKEFLSSLKYWLDVKNIS